MLIKTPATWAGIRATERLEREGIRCLVTLVCSEVQGRAAAEAGASIIATCELPVCTSEEEGADISYCMISGYVLDCHLLPD